MGNGSVKRKGKDEGKVRLGGRLRVGDGTYELGFADEECALEAALSVVELILLDVERP